MTDGKCEEIKYKPMKMWRRKDGERMQVLGRDEAPDPGWQAAQVTTTTAPYE